MATKAPHFVVDPALTTALATVTKDVDGNGLKRSRSSGSFSGRRFFLCFRSEDMDENDAVGPDRCLKGDEPVFSYVVPSGRKEGAVCRRIPSSLSLSDEKGGEVRRKKKSGHRRFSRVFRAVFFETSLVRIMIYIHIFIYIYFRLSFHYFCLKMTTCTNAALVLFLSVCFVTEASRSSSYSNVLDSPFPFLILWISILIFQETLFSLKKSWAVLFGILLFFWFYLLYFSVDQFKKPLGRTFFFFVLDNRISTFNPFCCDLRQLFFFLFHFLILCVKFLTFGSDSSLMLLTGEEDQKKSWAKGQAAKVKIRKPLERKLNAGRIFRQRK